MTPGGLGLATTLITKDCRRRLGEKQPWPLRSGPKRSNVEQIDGLTDMDIISVYVSLQPSLHVYNFTCVNFEIVDKRWPYPYHSPEPEEFVILETKESSALSLIGLQSAGILVHVI